MNSSPLADDLDLTLLQWLQDEFPLEKSPWEWAAKRLGISQHEVLHRVQTLYEKKVIRSLHVFVNPPKHPAGRSTLIAMSVPDEEMGRVVSIINEYPSVTHNYRRDHAYNLWFTINEYDEQALLDTLDEIKTRTGRDDASILNLRTLRIFKVDVRFSVIKTGGSISRGRQQISLEFPQMDSIDHLLLRITQEGIPLKHEPFQEIAWKAGIPLEEALTRLERMYNSGIIKRIGISLDQRRIGIVANALVAWKIPRELLERVGTKFASSEMVTHCYERSIVPGIWEYNVFTVLHGSDRRLVEKMVKLLSAEVSNQNYVILFSTEQFKRTSMIHSIPQDCDKGSPLRKII